MKMPCQPCLHHGILSRYISPGKMMKIPCQPCPHQGWASSQSVTTILTVARSVPLWIVWWKVTPETDVTHQCLPVADPGGFGGFGRTVKLISTLQVTIIIKRSCVTHQRQYNPSKIYENSTSCSTIIKLCATDLHQCSASYTVIKSCMSPLLILIILPVIWMKAKTVLVCHIHNIIYT